MTVLLVSLRDILRPRARKQLILGTLGSIVVSVLDSLGLVLILPLVNLATGQDDSTGVVGFLSRAVGEPSRQSLTVGLASAVVVLFVLKDVGSLVFTWWLSGFVNAERVRTSARILGAILSAPYTTIASRSSAEMMRTADSAVLQVFQYTVNGIMNLVAGAISIVAVLTALAAVAPVPTLVLVGYFGVAALVFDRLAKPRAAAAGAVMTDASLRGFRTAFAALGAVKEVKLRGTQAHFVDNFREAQLRGAYAGRTAGFLAALPKYILEILFIVAVGLVLVLGSRGDGGTGNAVGLIALFVAAGFRLLPSVSTLLTNASSVRIGNDALRIVHAEVRAQTDDHGVFALPVLEGTSTTTFNDRLTVEGVHFRYPGSDHDVLRDVWLDVPQGSSAALVGGSGAGKTTLVDVMLGLHTPSRGRVAVDGRDVSQDVRAWQRSIAYVAQDVFLLEATLAENVAFDQAPGDIDRVLVLEVLAQAQLTGVVEELPDGIDTEVGERGARLSGGQRQRIGLARALYRRCAVLVLDEATSALDNETEHRINQAIADLRGRVTVLVIAHRLSTVRHAEQVVFLDRGHVTSTGTFDEVRAASRDFARLVELGALGPDTVTSTEE
ncbi:ABC transporter ATP-binding protein/permease [Rhodococcus antarcticus]|uniref:ABC transporter ATP-binding protein/permease n=1 Tax=Rhodococcus antarcticus TaxID=2987751 RepID=A0ABY6P020_9NOCA|nr:ABC transporter ATP-binding protein [Rhodococcus antarcticus]UZJ24961.1 ABC transporter ATP-binding protein/permease [Rhodococcus antarcticus]